MKFQVFREGKLVNDFTLSGAYLFGTDGISIRRAKITFADGCIDCIRPNLETAGLALLWPIEGFGRVLLPTTCLPERDRPYVLNIELARAKLMQITNRREDWSFFDSLEGMEEISKQSQEQFIKAIQSIQDAPAASQLADESLPMRPSIRRSWRAARAGWFSTGGGRVTASAGGVWAVASIRT